MFRTKNLDEAELAKKAGFRFSTELNSWWCTHPADALKLRKFADDAAKNHFNSMFIKQTEFTGRLRYPKHLRPREYQLEGAKHLLTTNPCALGDDAGLGKTITSIIAVNSDPGPTLIVCPPSLKYNWEREIKKWNTHDASISIIEGKSDESYFTSNFVIFPDSLLGHRNLVSILSRTKFKWLLIDEAHRFKGINSQRTHVVYGDLLTFDEDLIHPPLVELAERVVVMSGTLMPNRPYELYPMLKKLAWEAIDFMPHEEFAYRYCEGRQTRYGLEARGCNFETLPELRAAMWDKFGIRRRKKDVLTELPAKQRQIIFLDAKSKATKKFEKEVLSKVKLSDFVGENKPLGEMATLRRLTGEDMVKPAAEFIKEALEGSNDKIIVFTHHQEVLRKLHRILFKFEPLIIPGGMTARGKQSVVDNFQTSPRRRLLIGQIEAMGVGFTLTAANRVIFAEFAWVYGINEQAEDRAHRMTQTKNVLVQYLIGKNTFSEYMMSKVFEKQKDVEAVFN